MLIIKKINKNISLAALLLLLALTSFATERVDKGLEKFLSHKSVENANNFFIILDEENYTDEPVVFDKSVHCDSIDATVLYWAADYYCNKEQNYHRSIELALSATEHLSEHCNGEMLSDFYSLLAADYFYLSDWDNATKYAKQCYEIDARSNDFDRISSSLNSLASIYQSANQPEKAEKYILKAIEYSHNANNRQRLAVLNGTAAEIYHSMGKDMQALNHAHEAYGIEMALGRYDKAAIRLAQAGGALLGLKRYGEAKKILKQAVDTLEAYGNTRSLAITYRKLAHAESALGDTAAAINHYSQAVLLCHKIGNLYNEAKAHAGLYKMLRHSNPAEAMEHIDRYNEIKDSLYTIDTSIVLADFDAQYDNAALKKKMDEQDRKITLMWWAIGLFILLAIVAGYMLLFLARTRRKNIITIERLRDEYERVLKNNTEKTEYGEGKDNANGGDMNKSEADILFVDRIISIINNQLDGGDVSIDFIASEMCMSHFQLRKNLLRITGQLPQEFVQNVRMTRACHLLDNRGDLSVNEIAQMCGYNDATNFIRSFKRIYSITPSQYRTRKSGIR